VRSVSGQVRRCLIDRNCSDSFVRGWLGAVVSFALESVSELVLVTPGSAEIVDPGVTRLAVPDPIMVTTPPIIPVVELGAAAVLESDVL